MWDSTRDRGILKLVHPGRHVEIHKKPITASEIMRKNPRHCIARPDVFKKPWTVVRPESLLVPGDIYYIVPIRTIYELLKARDNNQCLHLSKEAHDHQDLSKQLASLNLCPGATPKHQHHVRGLMEVSRNYVPADVKDSVKSLIKASQVFSWPEVRILDNRRRHQEFNCKYSQVRSLLNTRSSHPRRLLGTETGDLQIMKYEQINELKSCMGKQDSVRKLLNFKVSFLF